MRNHDMRIIKAKEILRKQIEKDKQLIKFLDKYQKK